MTASLLYLILSLVAFGVGCSAFAAGMRNGDRRHDAVVGLAEPDGSGRGIRFTVRNPASQPVLIGASVRRRSLRLRGEAGQFVSVPRSTLRDTLLAGQQAAVWAIAPGETQTLALALALSEPTPRRGELVVVIGEPDRLRVVRQAVRLCPRLAGDRPAGIGRERHGRRGQRRRRWPASARRRREHLQRRVGIS